MAFQLSPSVTVTERDLTTIVPTVATTNAGFAGLFEWGPVNKRVTVSSVQDLVSRFGLPRDNNFEYWFTAANYLGYGNNLQVVRGGDSASFKNAGPTMAGQAGGAAVYIPDEDSAPTTSPNPSVFNARYPGNFGNNLTVSFCGSATSAGATFSGWQYANNCSNGQPSSTSYGDRISGGNDAFHLVVVDRTGLISGATGNVIEVFENLSIIPGAVASDGTSIYYKNKINNSSKYIVAVGSAGLVGLTAGFTAGAASTVNYTVNGTVYTTGGVFTADLGGGTGEWNKGQLFSSSTGGYAQFADADIADVSLLMAGPATGSDAQAVTDLAKARKDCVAFVSVRNNDPTVVGDTKVANCKTLRDLVGNNNYAFIDSGYKYQYDAYNDTYRYVPLNGDIAGLCARTDAALDPWYSPAGFNRGQIRGAVKLAFNPSQTQRDTIYQYGINPVVTFPGQGTLLYGDRTAQTKASAFDRINVRRLFIVLEKAIATAAQYSLFEFNDAFTRAQFKSLVEPFLRDVQSRRGITDFKVVCNESNNTAAVIDSNRFVADIYIKPNRSVNYIQLNFIATRTGVSFDEVGA
jgi:hypothetical protein